MASYPFFYHEQFRKYIEQFLRIFSGIQVQYGVDRDGDGQLDTKKVPVFYGDMERIVATVLNERNPYHNVNVPLMTGYLSGIELDSQRRKNKFYTDSVIIKDKDGERRVVRRLMGVPYKMNMSLSILAANRTQMLQILEQILVIFNPYITIQKSDSIEDWAYLSKVELVSVGSESTYPTGTNEQLLIYTLQFVVDVYLTFPKQDHDKLIHDIDVTIRDTSISFPGIVVDEFTVKDTE